MFGSQLRCDKCNQYKPDRCVCKKDPTLKGVFGGNCNREACQQPNAVWYNYGTNKFYDRQCALEINKVDTKVELLIRGKPMCVESADGSEAI